MYQPYPLAKLTSEHIKHLCGELPTWKIAKMLNSEATYDELEAAVAYRGRTSGIPVARGRSLSGLQAYLYQIMTVDADIWKR